jgi:magnesium-transporting ATPase (P-type)
MKHTDFMGLAAANWNKLSDKDKEPYVKLQEKDQKRYEKQLKEWTKEGYFTLADGTKSSKWAKKKESESMSKSKSPKKMKKSKKRVSKPKP